MTAFSPVPSQTVARVAVLIDGDHIPPSLRPSITEQAQRLGQIVSTQLFCDLSMRGDWALETGLDSHHCKGQRPGKNSTDISLTIAALDLAYRGLAKTFLIVSNDRDFEPLVRHLDRIGCHARQVKLLPPVTDQASPEPPKPVAKTQSPPADPLIAKIRHAIQSKGTARGLTLSSLNHALSAQGFHISSTPQKTWHGWLKAHPEDFICDPKGPDAHVRVKP